MRASIYNLRQRVFKARSEYLFGSRRGMHPAEDEFDAHSFHFCCSVEEDVVAACRWSPPVDGAWEATRIAELPRTLRNEPIPPLQIGRVVVRDDLRRLQITEVMLYMACRWLTEHTSHTSYFALCVPQLARFYEHFGARVVPGQDVVLPERNNQRYEFLLGTLERSTDVIGRYLAGCEEPAWTLPPFPSSRVSN
jgi:predicted GNAT family N-acyltransferase